MVKAKAGGVRAAVRGLCSGAHFDLMVTEHSDLATEKLEAMMRKAAGAHQVNSYDWTNAAAAESATDGKGKKKAKAKTAQATAATAAEVAKRVGRKAARRASIKLAAKPESAAVAPAAAEVAASEAKAAATPQKEKEWAKKKRVVESAGAGWTKEGVEDTFRLGAIGINVLIAKLRRMTDANGELTLSSWTSGVYAISHADESAASTTMLEAVFEAVDADESGTVSFKELAAGISFFVAGDVASTCEAIFDFYGGEALHVSDLRAYIASMLSMAFHNSASLLAAYADTTPAKMADAMARAAFAHNRAGTMDLDEFKTWFARVSGQPCGAPTLAHEDELLGVTRRAAVEAALGARLVDMSTMLKTMRHFTVGGGELTSDGFARAVMTATGRAQASHAEKAIVSAVFVALDR